MSEATTPGVFVTDTCVISSALRGFIDSGAWSRALARYPFRENMAVEPRGYLPQRPRVKRWHAPRGARAPRDGDIKGPTEGAERSLCIAY